ncbi:MULTISPECIES: glycosyltransferase family 4 protein [unclassified Arthrobacter]|uniref:glycosyltransferase family 4 protein n=1 Tax=unclassified Arthrobacter TaxID=235627 RepID=UPI00298F177D|nr:glycosyltransferase family 4 protein [Arthrobacter sp. AET 35A]
MTDGAVLRNARLLGTTALRHLRDDPLLLVLQVSRRLPSGAVYRAAGAAAFLSRTPLTQAVAAYLRGDSSRTREVLRSALGADVRASTALRLAEVALAAGYPTMADEFIVRAQTSGAPDASRTIARRRWYDGDMSGAVEVLRAAGRNRTAERLESERRVFAGWTPTVPPVKGYVPRQHTVLHVLTNSLPHTGSGYAQRSHSILKAQHDAGWTVHAATRVGYPVQVGKLFAADIDVLDGVSYHRLLPSTLAEGFDGRLQQQAEELLALALQVRPTVLHTTTHFVNGLVVREVARALGIPWVYEVRGQLADTWASSRSDAAKKSERYRLFTESEAQVMQSANLVVTLGEAMKQDMVSKGVDPRKVLLCPNAVGDEYLDEPMDSGSARQSLGLPSDGVYIGTVSSIVDYEGLDDLLRAFAVLVPDHPGLRCLIVGDGVALPSLKTLAGQLGVSALVTFTGRVPRERARLHHQAIDIFVVPRKDLEVTRAVTPLKPVEAMASARVVVASDLPALREIVSADTGVLVSAGDVASLTSGIRGLLDDGGALSSEAIELGVFGRRDVLTNRTWTGTSFSLLHSYSGLERAA